MLYLGSVASTHMADRVQAAVATLEAALDDVLIDLIPSYASVLILFDPLLTDALQIRRRARRALESLTSFSGIAAREVVLPAYYASEVGADLEHLANRAGLSIEQAIDLHCSCEYRVYAIGFAPGFAYLGQVDERLATPRRATPRACVPRGSVAIADRQTAVYPAESPGGWNLIARCPVRMFDPRARPPMPVAVGDTVRFEAVSRERFIAMGGDTT
jgi:KipI family sensor histidine kinase inhibitor